MNTWKSASRTHQGGSALKQVRIVVGTRPQVIKLASLVKAFDAKRIEYSIVHTGQHYDFDMDEIFFKELGLPKPDAHLGIGSGSQGVQTGNMLVKLDEALDGAKLVIVPGDTNSALAGALAAVKKGIPVGHVEAGLRSWLEYMPEEINRVLVDHMSHLLFAPTKTGYDNLIREGIPRKKVFRTGDVMADNIAMFKGRISKASLPVDVPRKGFAYVTTHRAENVDDPKNLRTVVDMLSRFPGKHGLDIVFPVHPRTEKRLEDLGLADELRKVEGVHMIKPVSYLTSLRMTKDARIVLTDSGGLQKEAFILGTPAITLRDVTEWVESVDTAWNIITGLDPKKVDRAVKRFLTSEPKTIDPMRFYGGGKASVEIARIVKEAL